MLRLIFITGLLFFLGFTKAQKKEKLKLKDKFSIEGYIKYMNSSLIMSLDSIIGDNLIHNRIKINAFISDKITARVEMRNRVFYGEATRLNPSLGALLAQDNGQVDLSIVPLDKNAIVIHSILDRAYVKYMAKKWELRIGRQRINWGVNLAWNPNDLFNAYSLIDFDYQERPGSDALRFQYYTSDLSSIELAIQPGKKIDSSIIAGLWKFNKWKYDLQLLAGNYYNDLALGAGWAGNLKKSGLKGELTYFHPKENLVDTNGILSSSITIDYSFKNGIYINNSILFNSNGIGSINSTVNPFQSFFYELSPKSLMPSKFTCFSQVSGNFNPSLNASFSAFYMFGLDVLLVMPSINYAIAENWEIMLLSQTAAGKNNGQATSLGTGLFLRLMANF